MAAKYLSTEQWSLIKADYLGGIKPKELCAKYDVTYDALRNHIRTGQWVNEKRNYVKKSTEKFLDILTDKKAQTFEERAAEIEKMKAKTRVGAENIYTAIMRKLIITKPDGKMELNGALSSREISQLGSALKKAVELMFISHGEPYVIAKNIVDDQSGKRTLLDYLVAGDVDHALAQYNKQDGSDN